MVRLFRIDHDRWITNTNNPDGSLYSGVFERDIGRAGRCVTDGAGACTAGLTCTGDYLVIAKYTDAALSGTAYTGKPLSRQDFTDTNGDGVGDLVRKDFQVIKVVKRDGSVQFAGGSNLSIRPPPLLRGRRGGRG